jgi:hypothetical protein
LNLLLLLPFELCLHGCIFFNTFSLKCSSIVIDFVNCHFWIMELLFCCVWLFECFLLHYTEASSSLCVCSLCFHWIRYFFVPSGGTSTPTHTNTPYPLFCPPLFSNLIKKCVLSAPFWLRNFLCCFCLPTNVKSTVCVHVY